jgi:hypothetical protein
MRVILMGFLLGLFGTNLFAYDRKEWKHWTDADHDCQDTRQEVLIEESTPPAVLDKRGCRVVSGNWTDPYTGLTHTDPRELDVDHTIPLKLAAVSGGDAWSAEKKKAYANDLANPDHLIAIHKGINRSKGGKPIHLWHPKTPKSRCWYAHTYFQVKRIWAMTFTAGEVVGIMQELRQCLVLPMEEAK